MTLTLLPTKIFSHYVAQQDTLNENVRHCPEMNSNSPSHYSIGLSSYTSTVSNVRLVVIKSVSRYRDFIFRVSFLSQKHTDITRNFIVSICVRCTLTSHSWLQDQCEGQALVITGDWGSRISRQSVYEGCQLHAPAIFTPRKDSWYSFLLEAESTPGPQCDRKDQVTEKFQWLHRESNPQPSGL
jgi:hypothetical protein